MGHGKVGYGDVPNKQEKVGLILDCIRKLGRRRRAPLTGKKI